jgi:3-mercaptopyruvate sulfurtransferase SseA
MTLLNQVLRICAVSLALGVLVLAVRGAPRPGPAGGEQAVCSAPAAAELATPWVTLDDAHALSSEPGVLFVDCRPRAEFRGGHIASALSVPSDETEIRDEVVSRLRGARTIIAYCDARSGCASSVRLASRLRELGIADVRILTGGLPAWLDKGYPAQSGSCPLCPDDKP